VCFLLNMAWLFLGMKNKRQTKPTLTFRWVLSRKDGDDVARCLDMTNKPDKACTDVLHWWRTSGLGCFKYLA
jgi:hypothetical protein